MKLTSTIISALLALTTIACTTSAQTYVYTFDGKRTNGIDGSITVNYDSPKSTRATITAALDFSKVNTKAIVASDANCTGVNIVDYKWHIHVKWSSPYTSESLAKCGKALTGNHYDPLRACGPFSEFIDTPECKAKIAKAPYSCNPAAYQKKFGVCEKGDIGGKVGDLRLDSNKLVRKKWVDEHYPSVGENTPQWNFILHAVCGKATPRVACALGKAKSTNGYQGKPNDQGSKIGYPSQGTVQTGGY
jgi:hypothetical protein